MDAGDLIADAVVLDGTATVEGDKPFVTIDKIILPARTGPGQSVAAGVTNRFGLHFPIGSASDVIQIARKASGATSYTIEPLTSLTIDVNFATVKPGTVSAGDSFQFSALASQ
ncbi:MAG: hypothetical protein D6751_07360 [Deltaproteobacteria bacterium]|nr:MAG: hypothetical protein D6751_07360 [Deltaproteobacteria bacterium]